MFAMIEPSLLSLPGYTPGLLLTRGDITAHDHEFQYH
jgi:hypothetical protein